MIEYVALGDYEAAVGHLLASAPDKSARYYRDALCTLALAARAPPHAQWTHVGRPRHAVQALYSVAWFGDGPQGVFARRAEAGCIDVMHVPNVCVSCVCVCVCVCVCGWYPCAAFRVGHGPLQADMLMPGAPLRRPGAAQAASAEAPEAVPAGAHEQVSRTLHIQAAKVVAANAATIGDALLAVPLLCSAGAAPACLSSDEREPFHTVLPGH